MVVRDIERDDVEYISKTLGCMPVSHADHMKAEKLGAADLVQEVQVWPPPLGWRLWPRQCDGKHFWRSGMFVGHAHVHFKALRCLEDLRKLAHDRLTAKSVRQGG